MQSSLSPLLLPCSMQDNDENQPDYPFNSFFNDFMPISFQEANLPVLPPENPLDVQFDMCSPTNTNDLSESHSSSFSFVQETCENTDSSSLNTDHSSPEFSFLLNQSQKTISQWNLVSSVPSTNELKIDYLELLKQDKKIEAKKRRQYRMRVLEEKRRTGQIKYGPRVVYENRRIKALSRPRFHGRFGSN